MALNQEIRVQDDSILLQGDSPDDQVLLQIGTNDGLLYVSAPIIDLDRAEEKEGCLSALLALNSDTKNYPHGRIAGNAATNTADWIEACDRDLSATQLLELIRSRGILISQIRHALSDFKGS